MNYSRGPGARPSRSGPCRPETLLDRPAPSLLAQTVVQGGSRAEVGVSSQVRRRLRQTTPPELQALEGSMLDRTCSRRIRMPYLGRAMLPSLGPEDWLGGRPVMAE